MIIKLDKSLNDPEALIHFRRKFALGSSRTITTLSLCLLDEFITITKVDLATAIFSTVIMQQNDNTAAYFMSNVTAETFTFKKDIVVTGIYQSIALNCLPSAMAKQLRIWAEYDQSKDSDDIATAALAALAALSSKPPCDSTDTPGRIDAYDVVDLINDKIRSAQDDQQLTKAVYALANSRHPHVIDTVLNYTTHKSETVRSGAIRALGNVPTVCFVQAPSHSYAENSSETCHGASGSQRFAP